MSDHDHVHQEGASAKDGNDAPKIKYMKQNRKRRKMEAEKLLSFKDIIKWKDATPGTTRQGTERN